MAFCDCVYMVGDGFPMVFSEWGSLEKTNDFNRDKPMASIGNHREPIRNP